MEGNIISTYEIVLEKAIEIWQVTAEENADFDEHVRIADSVVPDLLGACPLCDYYSFNGKQICAFCPLGPKCIDYNKWRESTTPKERKRAADKMVEVLKGLLNAYIDDN